jgi:hypothetical protein
VSDIDHHAPGPIFTEADLCRATDALDVLFQNDAPPEEETEIPEGRLVASLQEGGITSALAVALIERLIADGVFKVGQRSFIALRQSYYLDGGTADTWSEISRCLQITRERWYCWLAEHKSRRGPTATPGGKAVGNTRQVAHLSKDEANQLVSEYLRTHKQRAAVGEVGIREVNQETGVPVSSIQRTLAWRALQDALEQKGLSRRPRRRKAQAFTNKMDGVAGDAALHQLMEQQKADDEGSPLDKGRRGKVRVRKKI